MTLLLFACNVRVGVFGVLLFAFVVIVSVVFVVCA